MTIDPISRRKFIKGSAIAAGTAIAAGSLPRTAFGYNAVGSISSTPYFNMVGHGVVAFMPDGMNQLHDFQLYCHSTHTQSFAFDALNQRLYVVQCRGMMYTGDKDSSAHGAWGDLVITELNYTMQIQSHMYVNGAGHGTNIGIRPTAVGQAPYIYIEGECDTPTSGCTNGGGASCDAYGTLVIRFAWTGDGNINETPMNTINCIAHNDPDYGSKTPVGYERFFTGQTYADGVSCHIDPYYNRMVVRYHHAGSTGKSYKVFTLSEFEAKDYSSPLITFDEPAPGNLADGSPAGSWNGYTIHGEYLYIFYGSASSGCVTANSTMAVGIYNVNSAVTTIVTSNMHSTNPYYYDPGREAGGIAVYLDNPTSPTVQKLCLGIGSFPVGSTCAVNGHVLSVPTIGSYTG